MKDLFCWERLTAHKRMKQIYVLIRMFSDLTCMQLANDVSCQRMLQLAKQEFALNQGPMLYAIDNPTCAMNLELADRGQEYLLQKPAQFARNLCFVKKPTYGEGTWVHQYAGIDRVEFDINTRRKTQTVQK